MIGNIYTKAICKRVVPFVIIQLFFNTYSIQAQNTVLGGGANMKVLSDTKVSIAGDMLILGDRATIDNSGDLDVTGDWINDAASPGFINQSPGTFTMSGDTQFITGAFPTDFYNLELEGTGLKILANNANILDSIYLNNLQLATIGNTLNLLNTDTGAISRITGYVSIDTSGSLAWNMLGTGQYIFPLGSDHIYKYRPVGIQNTIPDSLITLSVSMAGNDPALNGYSRSLTDTSLCAINGGFYDLIKVISGTSPVNLTFFYDTSDGSFNRTAYWMGYNNDNNWEWSSTGNNLYGTAPPFQTITANSWNNFNSPAFALAIKGAAVQPVLIPSGPLSFCPGGNVTLNISGSYQDYQWSTGASGPSILVDSSGRYYVTVAGTGQCAGVTSDTVAVDTVRPRLLASGPLTFCDTANGVTLSVAGSYTSYQWSDGNISSSINADSTNSYVVTVTDAIGCTGEASDNVSITICTGIGSISSAQAIKVFPNPTTGLVNISMEGLESQVAEFSLYNELGKKVKYMTSDGESSVDMYLNDLASGAYILDISAAGSLYKQKIILTR